MFLSSHRICAHFKNMKGMGRGSGYSSLIVFGTFRSSGYDVRPSVENCRKRFVTNKSRRGFYRVVCTNRREFGPERERRDQAVKGMYKGVKTGRGRSEIDTVEEVSLAIPAISSRVTRFQFVTDIISDSLLLVHYCS